MTDLSKVTAELVAHLEHLKHEAKNNPSVPGMKAARERAEKIFPMRWGKADSIFKQTDYIIMSAQRELKIRIYRPENPKGSILFLHGGGWVNGSIYTHDGSCIMLAIQSQMAVVSVNYSKAPEYKFPAGLNDGLVSLDWLVAHSVELGLNANNIMVAGESSGGNIAAVVARHAVDNGVKLTGQILIYPATDAHMNTESYRLFGHGYMVSAEDLSNCYQNYLPLNADLSNPDISPLLADDVSGLCPTFIATCDHDPLRDDGRLYAAKLCQAGVNTTLVEMRGALHGIWIMKAVTPLAEKLVNHVADWVNTQNSLHKI